jgi:hypothetical protein
LREERRLEVYENRVLRRICGPKGAQGNREWRNIHNEEIICTAHKILFDVIKSRRMRWAGHIARMGRRSIYRVLVGNPREGDHLGDPGAGKRIILKRMFT